MVQIMRWDCKLFHRVGDAGHFEGRRPRLFDGVIFAEGWMSPAEATGIELTHQALLPIFRPGWCIRCQTPLVLGPDTDPVPDFAIVRGEPREHRGHPTTADLIVEIADQSLDFDTTRKRLLYATATIQEYWVVDINGRRLIVYRDPRNGDYASRQELGPTETLSPLAAPSATVRVADLLV